MIGKDDFAYAKLKGIDSSMAQTRRDRFNEVLNSEIPISWLDTQVGNDGKTKHKERRFFVDKANNFVIGYAVDITDLIEKETLLSASIEEKVTLLGEIHHRVKNNLALVVGLIEMEVFRSTDTLLINQLKEVLRKISAIGLIHEKLYQSNNFSSIDMPHYIKDFVKLSMDINQSHVAPVIHYDFDEILLNTQQSIPLALCLNELLINSQKHAFPDNPAPQIRISLRKEDEMLVFKYADNGKGIAADTDISKLKSLGFKLILIFIKQLKGTYVITNESGFEISITFKTIIAAHNKSVALTR
jgi:two-component sensor histidine kinase